jgi:4-hydroxybenzoate polyprenyltransferase
MTDAATRSFPEQAIAFAGDIKLSHTVFALPFALLSAALVLTMPGRAVPGWGVLVWVVLCMVAARTFAMGMNRVLDARIDASNPRTASRAIPAGRLSVRSAVALTLAAGVAFQLFTLAFGFFHNNWLPAMLAGPVLIVLGGYPLMKRFTKWCHVYLGFCLGLAPICAWIALAGPMSLTPLAIAAAVMLWTAGFDILYATADVDADRSAGLFSLPSRWGVRRALWTARLFHAIAAGMLILAGLLSPQLHLLWFAAVAIVCLILIIEHTLVRPGDLSKLNLAFFTLNGIVSLTLGSLGILDALMPS